MKRMLTLTVATMVVAGLAMAQTPGGGQGHGYGQGHSGHAAPDFKLPVDGRTAIAFPPDVRDFFKYEMRGHLEQLNTLMTRLAEGDMKGAGAFARSGLAVAGNHPPGAPSPGRFAPPEFRAMGQAMHMAAGDVAKAAEAAANPPTAADWVSVTSAVSTLTAACAGCHGAFRVK